MSDYIMAPGARLEVSNRGQLYETLGSCCASCEAGRPCRGSGSKSMGGIGSSAGTVGVLAFGVVVLYWVLTKPYGKKV